MHRPRASAPTAMQAQRFFRQAPASPQGHQSQNEGVRPGDKSGKRPEGEIGQYQIASRQDSRAQIGGAPHGIDQSQHAQHGPQHASQFCRKNGWGEQLEQPAVDQEKIRPIDKAVLGRAFQIVVHGRTFHGRPGNRGNVRLDEGEKIAKDEVPHTDQGVVENEQQRQIGEQNFCAPRRHSGR